MLPSAVASVVRQAPLCDEKVGFAWRLAVGPAIDRATHVTLRETTLHVDTRDVAWRREIAASAPVILRRLATVLGPGIVASIALTHVPPR